MNRCPVRKPAGRQADKQAGPLHRSIPADLKYTNNPNISFIKS